MQHHPQEHQHKDTVRLNFEFPISEYPYLKMVCARKGLSLREFATELLIKAIDEAEDEMLAEKANERLEKMKSDELISFDQAIRLAGWTDEKI